MRRSSIEDVQPGRGFDESYKTYLAEWFRTAKCPRNSPNLFPNGPENVWFVEGLDTLDVLLDTRAPQYLLDYIPAFVKGLIAIVVWNRVI